MANWLTAVTLGAVGGALFAGWQHLHGGAVVACVAIGALIMAKVA